MVFFSLGQPAVTLVGALNTRFGIFHLDLRENKSSEHFVSFCQGTRQTCKSNLIRLNKNMIIERMCRTAQPTVALRV